MSKRSEKRSTIFPFPSSPHWEPRMMTFPILSKGFILTCGAHGRSLYFTVLAAQHGAVGVERHLGRRRRHGDGEAGGAASGTHPLGDGAPARRLYLHRHERAEILVHVRLLDSPNQ